MLGVYPGEQLRLTIAIYILSQAAEVAYNLAEEQGWIWGKHERPWWFGSWMLVPLSCGQLLHAFVFDNDCFPAQFSSFVLKYSPGYIQMRPEDYPNHLPWPNARDIVDNLGAMSKMKHP